MFGSRRWRLKRADSAFFFFFGVFLLCLHQLSLYFGFVSQVLLQVFIILSGNYNFFNLLTLTLCLSLLDDEHVNFWLRKRSISSDGGTSKDTTLVFAFVTSHFYPVSLFRLCLWVAALLPAGVGGLVSPDCWNYFLLRHAAGYD